jgi:hypothetical protein
MLHIAFLLTYALVYPTWTGYDEAQHVDMVYGLQHGAGWPGPGEKTMMQGVTATSDDFDRGRFAQMFLHGQKRAGAAPFVEIDPIPRETRKSFDEMGGAAPVTDQRLSNQMIQHPPLVYAVGAGLLSAVPGSQDWAYDQQVFLLRLLNIALVAPLPVLAWLAARRFGLAEPLAQAAALLPLAIPGLTRVGSSFNNDGIIILSTSVLTVLLVGVMRGDLRLRTSAWVAVWLGVALLSKAFALTLPVVIAAAYLVGARAARSDGRDGAPVSPARVGHRRATAERLRVGVTSLPWKPALLAIGLGLTLGGWWWVRNVVLYGAVSPNGWAMDPPRREPLLLPESFFTWFWYFFRVMISRFWGGLGLFEPPQLSPIAIVTATVTVTACCVAAIARRPRLRLRTGAEHHEKAVSNRSAFGPPAALVVLLLPMAFTYLMVGQRSYAEYERYIRGIAVQGRYLYLGLVGLAVVAVIGLHRLLGGRDRLAPPVMLAGALTMQALGLLAVCSYYWLPRQVAFTPAGLADIVAGIARWAPFPTGVTVTVFALTAVLTLAVAGDMARRHQASSEHGQLPESPAGKVLSPESGLV